MEKKLWEQEDLGVLIDSVTETEIKTWNKNQEVGFLVDVLARLAASLV